MSKHVPGQPLARRKKAVKHTGTGTAALLPAIVVSFACGVGLAVLLLAVFAFACERFSLPVTWVRPLALAAAWCGAAVSGLVLAGRLGRLRLLCGLGCGAFYCLCLLAAGCIAAGNVQPQSVDWALPAALLLGGVAGSAVSALRTGSGAVPR